MRSDHFGDTCVICVEPIALLRGQFLRDYEPPIDWCEGQRFETHGFEVTVRGPLWLSDQHKVLYPDAVGPLLIITRLVRDDHAGLEHCRAALRNRLRAL